MTKVGVEAVAKEIKILEEINHPNIVKMVQHFEDKGHYCLVLELLEGGEVRKKNCKINFCLAFRPHCLIRKIWRGISVENNGTNI